MNEIKIKEPTREIIDLAVSILKNTPYELQKEIIKKVFSNTSDKKEDIILRLIIIDSCYSTNLSKRLFGFEDISEFLFKIKSDIEKLKEKKIDEIQFFKIYEKDLKGNYGINKKGNKKGRAFSLISKYLYFRSFDGKDFNFPIYDSLVRKGLNDLGKLKKSSEVNVKYFVELKELRERLGCQIDDLDKYFWILGKIGNPKKEKGVKMVNPSLLIKDLETYKNDFMPAMKDKIDLNSFINADFKSKELKEMQKFAKMVQINNTN